MYVILILRFVVVFVNLCSCCIYYLLCELKSKKKLYGAAEQPYNQKVNEELILNLVQSLEFTSYYGLKIYIARWPPAHINHV